MPYRVEIAPAAQRGLKGVPPTLRKALELAICTLEEEPRPAGVRKIRGAQRAWRLRVRDFRIVYEVHDDSKLVLVLKVDRRRERTYRRIWPDKPVKLPLHDRGVTPAPSSPPGPPGPWPG